MKDAPKVKDYPNFAKLVERLRDALNNYAIVLLFAYNGTGKTRLCRAFKDKGKKGNNRDTLYFSAYTEDLFSWDNDLEEDKNYCLHFNEKSRFFQGFKELALEDRITSYLSRYADFDFDIDYDNWCIYFSRENDEKIKISRGEENIFIWCIFLAICELVKEKYAAYNWVKYIYIDDPISSLDDNNAIAIAVDLCHLLKNIENIKCVISSHHGLFFNVMWNELKNSKLKYATFFYNRINGEKQYSLQSTDETPFFHHVAMLSELKQAVNSGNIFTHHFNALRSIMEKTAVFFNYKDFSYCIHGIDDEVLYSRALNLLSHGKYSMYQPQKMGDDTKKLFIEIYEQFIKRYAFNLPALTEQHQKGE